ncbi:YybH family protein [Tunturibacter empetritectus]|uniref:Ketosteroid isomerase-like protein n=1 Tax=Tunturiibacter lichenicola TaxID=2051959 RepID=A0A7W8JBA6_9BACT|nr:nuclear transport factor 2 family protein [Edaphobacter lichenicola]MBB5346104.1 ketosteroid isomerase-like protein [Edaphobacter lichenicola]
MRKRLIVLTVFLAVALSVFAQAMLAQTTGPGSHSEGSHPDIDAFNRSLEDATFRMDNAATVALWTEEGVSLLPSTKPIVGKAAIAAFLDRVTAQFPGARMEKFELKCFDIEVSGDLASEWCTEHQVVHMPDGKPPFDGRGRMLLVLRKSSEGRWRLEREMWIPAEAD